jgi:hypothetical protein
VLPDTSKLANISQVYMAAVEKKFRDAGIVVPSILNDAYPHGYFAPGTGPGAVDVYGFDGYRQINPLQHEI